MAHTYTPRATDPSSLFFCPLHVQNTAGLGVQIASNQAIYFDDQMSDWLVTNNTFVECQVGTFTGGGRRNIITGNTYINVGTVHYLNNQGMLLVVVPVTRANLHAHSARIATFAPVVLPPTPLLQA